ncbi:MAG: hypothetical protein US66_C0016G0005 [Candidatus Moranbacteria bacterium GW2011_GWD2_37_9]|nr:MAG: hypothetical protein US44_C0008G0024 [Candidatus Moranbacteria bacterium GW2011_GWD1_37_17]KKQ47206.1 MAG: hypothetical protein US66_C0016G0005 [Candidatus Moranbacteria bacterium GW2011_GWD2_37_9]HBO16874.1 hypothetical protein [Candidatus Moranbacteria bacterium]
MKYDTTIEPGTEVFLANKIIRTRRRFFVLEDNGEVLLVLKVYGKPNFAKHPKYGYPVAICDKVMFRSISGFPPSRE